MKENRLRSRKFWAFVGATVLSIAYPPAFAVLKILAPTYIGAQGAVDLAEALKAAKR